VQAGDHYYFHSLCQSLGEAIATFVSTELPHQDTRAEFAPKYFNAIRTLIGVVLSTRTSDSMNTAAWPKVVVNTSGRAATLATQDLKPHKTFHPVSAHECMCKCWHTEPVCCCTVDCTILLRSIRAFVQRVQSCSSVRTHIRLSVFRLCRNHDIAQCTHRFG
jgi:hypothetical protein